jgi:hypothetical protein
MCLYTMYVCTLKSVTKPTKIVSAYIPMCVVSHAGTQNDDVIADVFTLIHIYASVSYHTQVLYTCTKWGAENEGLEVLYILMLFYVYIYIYICIIRIYNVYVECRSEVYAGAQKMLGLTSSLYTKKRRY